MAFDRSVKIAPSILSADFANFELKSVQSKIKVQIGFMWMSWMGILFRT